jgi:hypothetical protein
MVRVVPVTKPESSDARKRASFATSSDVPALGHESDPREIESMGAAVSDQMLSQA